MMYVQGHLRLISTQPGLTSAFVLHHVVNLPYATPNVGIY